MNSFILLGNSHLCFVQGAVLTKIITDNCVSGKLCLGFPGGSAVKNLSAMQETRVRSLTWEDPLQKRMATHSSILAWKIPRTEERGGLQSLGSQRVGHS